jgi:hypothetical protein
MGIGNGKGDEIGEGGEEIPKPWEFCDNQVRFGRFD